MKLVKELKDINDESIIAVLTGNGRTEVGILKHLAERHNGNGKVLFFPSLPIHSRRGSGISVLRAVKTYVDTYKIRNTLFLVDREHFNEDDIAEKTDGTLKSYGIDVQNIDQFQGKRECALLIRASVGNSEISIYMAVLGQEKCIEEDIAKLIELELGMKIEPNKVTIHRSLRDQGINKYTLVKNAQSSNLRKAFPALNLILELIKKLDT